MWNLDVMPDGSEVVHYNHPNLPLFIRRGNILNYDHRQTLCHWHEDVELSFVLKGSMEYYAGGDHVHVSEGDAIVVNSRQMHFNYSTSGKECRYICVLFPNDLFTDNAYLKHTFFQAVTESGIRHFDFKKSDTSPLEKEERQRVELIARQVMVLQEKQERGSDLEILSLLYRLWDILLQKTFRMQGESKAPLSPEEHELRVMVSYLHLHYAEDITLNEIAGAANIGRTKCCSLFKENTNLSPMEFLNTYRLEKAREKLAMPGSRVGDTATSCGFNSLSYFTKMFRRKYGVTPKEYRASLKM